jgi:hypothetical protein
MHPTMAHACSRCLLYLVYVNHQSDFSDNTNDRTVTTVDTFLEASITQENQRRCSLVRRGRSAAQGRTVRDLARGGGALCARADCPWPGAGRSAAWCAARAPAGRSAPWGRTVRVCTGATEDRRRRLDLAPGRDPVGEERS